MFLDPTKSIKFIPRQSVLFHMGYFGNFDLNILFYPLKMVNKEKLELKVVTELNYGRGSFRCFLTLLSHLNLF